MTDLHAQRMRRPPSSGLEAAEELVEIDDGDTY
jgi:hypothetical protein